LSAEAPLRESIARLEISTCKLTAGGDLYPAAAETRWHNFAAANYSRLSFHAVCKLLALGMDPSTTDCAGRTPSHYLAMKHSSKWTASRCNMQAIELVKVLWQCQPKLYAQDYEDRTAFDYAKETVSEHQVHTKLGQW
jgi:hypothetical protein